MQGSRWASFGLFLVCFLILSPGIATASDGTLELTVVNSLGIPQFGVFIKSAGTQVATTNGGGEASLELGSSVSPGETLELARYPGKEPPPLVPCAPPAEYVSYTIPDPPPSAATVTIPSLPSSSDLAFEPGLSDPELKFLGLMNNLRRSSGATPLQASTTLDAVADRYLSRLKSVSLEEQPHCVVASPPLRAVDAGFPTGSVGENLAYNGMCSAEGTYEAFYSEKGKPDDGHYLNMIDPEYTTVGLATDGSSWVIDFADLSLADPFVGRAGLTGQMGDASLPDANCEFESLARQPSTDHQTRRNGPDLRILRAKVVKSVLHLTVRVRSGAEGRIVARAQQIMSSRHGLRLFPLTGDGVTRQKKIRLGYGRWRILVRFVPLSGSGWRRDSARCEVVVGPR